MGINYFLGWNKEDLLRSLREAQEDLAAGKTIMSAGAGDANSASRVEKSIEARILMLLKALNAIDPDNYPIGSITAITQTKIAFSRYQAPEPAVAVAEAAEEEEEDDSVYDNGVDPFLGAPFPPVNYQLFINDGVLTWTVPDVLIKWINETVEIDPPPLSPIYYVKITNYDSGETLGSQSGTTVTLSGGTFRFVDTATDAGKLIRFATGETATVVTVTSETTATVSTNQTVAATVFAYLHPNMTFELWAQNPQSGQFEKVTDSDAAPYPSTLFTYGYKEDTGEPIFRIHLSIPGVEVLTVPAYVKAVSGDDEALSALNNIGIHQIMFP